MTRAVWWVVRRELHVMVRAPILYVVGGMFLVVQGVAFAGLVNALTAEPLGRIATTDARWMPCPPAVTRPAIVPVEAGKEAAG